MVSWVWLVVAIVVVVAVAAALFAYTQRRRRGEWRSRFGPEYDRAVESQGRKAGELELAKREQRIQSLDLRKLSREEQELFGSRWRAVQARFVDDPAGAMGDADGLLTEVMRTRGYPVGDFEQRAADLSVEHGRVIDNYRAGHDIAERHRRGQASTEDLREGMVRYRALFEELIGERVNVAGRTEVRHD
jgi:hypothetical protein